MRLFYSRSFVLCNSKYLFNIYKNHVNHRLISIHHHISCCKINEKEEGVQGEFHVLSIPLVSMYTTFVQMCFECLVIHTVDISPQEVIHCTIVTTYRQRISYTSKFLGGRGGGRRGEIRTIAINHAVKDFGQVSCVYNSAKLSPI